MVNSAQAALGGFLVKSTPADGSRQSVPPRDVVLIFSLPLASGSKVSVSGPTGNITSASPLILGDTATQLLPSGLSNGDYTVTYDADFGVLGTTSGSVRFSVGPTPSTSSPTVTSPPPSGTGGGNPSMSGRAGAGSRTPAGPTSGGPAQVRTTPASVRATPTMPAAPVQTGAAASEDAFLPPWPVLLLLATTVAALLLELRRSRRA
jgi:hypothetical protein